MSSSPDRSATHSGDSSFEPSDAVQHKFDFGDGGVPWYLLLVYLAFLVFFTWYVLEYQLPDFMKQGPTRAAHGQEVPGK